MNRSGAAVRVGLTAIAIAVVSFTGFRFVAKGMRGQSGYFVWALFRDATGLVDKSRVQVAGLQIGEIAGRRLEGAMAQVTIRVQPNVVLWSNASVFKKSASLLGDFYLEIDPGTPESPDPLTNRIVKNEPLKDGEQIRNVIEAVTTTDILVQVNETLPVLRQILLDVRKLTSGPMNEIAESLHRGIDRNSAAAERVLNQLEQISLDVHGLTGGPANQDLQASIHNLREITANVRDIVGDENTTHSAGNKLKNDLDKISVALDSLNHTLGNMARLSDKTAAGKGTVGRLLNDETIANNVEQITEDVGGFVSSITRLQTLVGLRSEYNFVANSLKTYVGIQLQSRPDKFFLIELIDDPRGDRTVQNTFTITDDPSKPQTTHTQTVTNADKFRFSFQIAKKLFLLNGRLNLTGRFGIKESTGGIGFDIEAPLSAVSPWTRTLEIKLDLFDFRSNINPRFKIMAALEFYRHIWLVGGVDDILNSSGPGASGLIGRDYFFGAQLTFNDDDLRALLTVGGAALFGGGGK